MSETKRWVLTDEDTGTWIEDLNLNAADLGVPESSGASLSKSVLHGGLREGVEVVQVGNGALSFTVLPTRGMGLWRGQYAGRQIGWHSPVRGPVHPKFIHANDRGGLGWLQGFDECIVRCGLESNGAPCTDVLPNNMGVPTAIELGLHGRIANLPAHYVAVEVIPGNPAEICVTGIVDEGMLFCPHFRLVTEYRTTIGSNIVRITDRVTNLGSTPSEMELLYHCNFGAPFLDEGAQLILPAAATMPRDAGAATSIDSWASYRAPTPGYVEQCYWHVPLADANGNTVALLANAAQSVGVAVRTNITQMPCFTQWKNTAAQSDGYVTGLEPGTDYPNGRDFERRQGRVVTLAPGQVYRVDLALEVCEGPERVTAVKQEIAAIQGDTVATVHREPVAGYSDLGD